MLFSNCGAVADGSEIDFRVGGGYKNFFSNAGLTCCGKFLEIVQDKKIVFTWGDVGSDEGFPKTNVSIELMPDSGGSKTKILIVHTGFASQEDAEAHDYGWNAGLNDMDEELVNGRIRIVRTFPVSRDVLYSACSDVRKFFGIVSKVDQGGADFRVGGKYRFPTEKGEIFGEFQEIIPGKKIAFSWLSGCDHVYEKPTRVTLLFDDEDEGGSSLELVHEFLPVGDSVTNTRKGWEYLTAQLQKLLK
jgi:uncharacterized protein YndB with AHSA1/START domain